MKFKILLAVLAIPLVVLAERGTKKTQSAFLFDAAGVPTQALAKNKNRKGLIVSNNGADTVYIQFGSSSASVDPQNTDAMRLAGNTAHEFQNVPMDAIYIKGAASTGTRRIGIIEFE
jgi:hypothetical protein